MMYLVGLLVLVVGLLLSVALHEFGHLLPAKKFGAVVPEYFIGFGPTLFKKKVGKTTYGVKGILLGGYVRILGMYPEAQAVGAPRTSKETLADQAREQSSQELAAARAQGDTGTPFYQLKTHQKLAVMFGGPLTNLILAFVLILIVVSGIGRAEAQTVLAEVTPGGPAAEAGIRAGDRIVSWNGTPTPEWMDVREAIVAGDTDEAEVIVERQGQSVAAIVTPREVAGQPQVGIRASEIRVRGGFTEALSTTGDTLMGTVRAVGGLPVSLWNLTTGLFTDEPRDPNGALSVVGVAHVAGEITSTTSEQGWAFADRVALLLSLLASLNIALFVFNLIPLPPLDGGHIAGALYGGIKNGWARLRGKPQPRPVDTARMVPLAYGVFVVLIGLALVLVVADVVKPMELFG